MKEIVVCYRSVTQQDIGPLSVTMAGIVIVHVLLVMILDIMPLVSINLLIICEIVMLTCNFNTTLKFIAIHTMTHKFMVYIINLYLFEYITMAYVTVDSNLKSKFVHI